jgi:hypothetical protein
MDAGNNDNRRRDSRPESVGRVSAGAAARGVIVATGLAAAIVLQLAGSRLEDRLADLMGTSSATPVAPSASTPGCGSSSGDNPMHACKVATAAAGTAPVI